MRNYIVTAIIALVFGLAGAGIWSISGLGNGQVRDYLVANPEILPEMAQAYQQGQSQERLAEVKDAVDDVFPGAVLGNPNGSKVLVKFTDFACTYCRQSVAQVDRLIAADPELKVVIREWPIFEGSETWARIGLAAAKQGKYASFYHEMFKLGPPNATTIEQAARIAGVDLEAASAYATSEEVTAELERNMALARTLGFTGTPSWIAGGEVVEGLVPTSRLAEALDIKI
ncbi:DsbA family protein [Qipengyuania sp. RANM35]|uniref:DsbA family protein n=1 Tax=Qipengyuania sp. RANM35 TaxID=3068635 RepID=UPI0034DACAC6